MIKGTAEYKEYLASREWAVLREKVRERSGDKCERCYTNKQDAVHHKTYERVGCEKLEDLQAICTPCHEYLSGKREIDPLSEREDFDPKKMIAEFGGMLRCPNCLDFYTHFKKTYKLEEKNWRGVAQVLRFYCETCPIEFELIFQQHKGNTYFQVRRALPED